VVVNDLDVGGPGVCPGETDPPLLVDPDAVLAGPVTVEGFEPIARGYPQIVECLGGLKHHQLAERDPLDPGIK
jgi:hypothetical protein